MSTSTPGGRFIIWPNGTDPYDHVQLTSNWNTNDALIGAPGSGTWPPTTGLNGGIYKEVTLLKQERVPVGTVISWFRPSAAVAVPNGWLVCDGSTIGSGAHDFTGFVGSVILPDMRNRFVIGASTATTYGQTDDTAPTVAPGETAVGGSNSFAHSHTIPDHYHNHNHRHEATTTVTSATVPTGQPYDNSVAAGGAFIAPGPSHRHDVTLDFMTSRPRVDTTNLNDPSLLQTSVQVPSPTGGDDNAPTGGTQGADLVTNSVTVSARPAYVGLLYLIKVKYQAVLL